MNKIHALPTANSRPRGLSLLLRWLVLLLVVFDLVSAPWHAHAHDAGGGIAGVHGLDGAGAHAAIDDLDDHDEPAHHGLTHPWVSDAAHDAAHHVDGAHAHGAVHSMLALVPSKLAAVVVAVRVIVLVPLQPTAVNDDPLRLNWRAALVQLPSSHDRHDRPISRAPPSSLHT